MTVLLVFHTPETLSHYARLVHLSRCYRIRGKSRSRMWRVTYRHDRVDGTLLHNQLRTSWRETLRPVPLWRATPSCKWKTRLDLDSCEDVVGGVQESDFLRLVAYLCRRSAVARHKSVVRSSVMVSTRHKLPDMNEPGCFVRFATVEWTGGVRSAQRIASSHRQAIREVLADDASPCDPFSRMMASAWGSDLIFNKWMLDRIVCDDGTVLELHRGGRHVTLDFLLSIDTGPLYWKCVHEHDRVWTLLVDRHPR